MTRAEDLENAKDLVREGKVAHLVDAKIDLTDHYVVTGSKDDYLVILPSFCTCRHFNITCVKTPGQVCKHILACRISSGKIREVQVDDWKELLFRDQ